MQKIWFGLFGLIITTGAFAADLCVRNDAMVVAMNPDINGTINDYYETGVKTWSTKFSYGIISGIAACATDCTTTGCIATNQNISAASTGAYCYCKMLKPVLSHWLHGSRYYPGYSTDSNGCANKCAFNCAYNSANSPQFRRALFQSVNMIE